MEKKIPVWLLPSILVAALLSLVSISFRYRVESHNKAATVALEIETVEALALGQGLTVDQAIQKLKAQGLGALVLSEETVGDLTTSHAIEISQGPVIHGTFASINRVENAVRRRFPAATLVRPERALFREGRNMLDAAALDLSKPGSPTVFNLRMLSVGLDDEETQIAKRNGLRIIARFGNPIGASDQYVSSTLEEAHRQGAEIFLPVGDQVLGRRFGEKTLINTLKRLNMLYASPEFAKLGGDANMVSDAPELVVRLHSAQSAELDKLPLPEAVDRYSRAARERNQRILLVRAFNFSSATPLDDMSDFILRISRSVAKEGGAIGPAKPFEDSKVPSLLFALVGLSLAPTIWFSVGYFVRHRVVRLAGAVALVLASAACISSMLPARSIVAFLAAVAFPIVSFQVLEARKGKYWLADYLLVSGISLVGGLGVAGLMNGLPYFIKAEQFEGVKAAVFLPVVVVAGLMYARLADLKSSLRSPITWSSLALALLLLGAMAFMISRTGNDNPAGVSGAELRLRSLLDTLLFVRPRTKEFLVGHPFLILGIAMLMRLRSGRWTPNGFAGWTALALTIGAVGQTDIVNTLCHFHTPVALSLERVLVGLVAGGILGAVLWAAVSMLLPKGPPLATPDTVTEAEPERSEIAH